MLTGRQIEIIVVELVTGKAPSIRGAEADAFRKQVAKEIEEGKAKGMMVDLPSDLDA